MTARKTKTSEHGTRTTREIGFSEPGFDKFAAAYRRQGSSEYAIGRYAEFIGMVRNLSGKPLLDLSIEELEALDLKLLKHAKVLRTALKMFYNGCKRTDLRDALPRQRRQKERRMSEDEILTQEDVMKILGECSNLRDRALISVLAATGARISEVLGIRLKDIKHANGDGYQIWFGQTKVKSQERYSPNFNGVWKKNVDAWLAKHPARNNPDAILFPSTARDAGMSDSTVGQLIKTLAAKAGVTKPVNPHMFRHARVTWGILNGEDSAKLSVGIWGKPASTMLNRYSHFSGRDAKPETTDWEEFQFPEVPPLPEPIVSATQARVKELEAKLAKFESMAASWIDILAKATPKSLAAMKRFIPGANETTK